MRKVLFILGHEIFTVMHRTSFWVITLLLPTITLAIFASQAWQIMRQGPPPSATIDEIGKLLAREEDLRPQGYVDLAGLIGLRTIESTGSSPLIGFANEGRAMDALQAGEISAFYVIPADYIDEMQVSLYTQEYDAFISQEHYAQIVGLLTTRILNQRVDQIEIILRPLAGLEEHNLSPSTEPVRDQDNLLTMLLPYGVMVFFYFAIMGTASMMFSSFSKEKENRVLEILINSATPYQIMGGKIIALGLVGLFQVALNGMSALVMLKYSIEQFDLPIEYLLDFSILGWGLVFFIFGYLLYAALLSGVGALVPNIRETSQLTSILFLPGMIPFFLISILIDSPNGGLAVFLSLFPLTAPTTMLLRLSAAAVPLWQLGLALTLLAASALLVTHLAARLFRAQNLLSGQSFQVRRFVRALLGRA